MIFKSSVLRPAILAISSQVISSLTNFAFILNLLKTLDPAEFGLYSISFAFVLAGGAVLQGFFQIQMVTGLAHLQEKDRLSFTSSLFIAQNAVGLLLVLGVYATTRFASSTSEESLLAIATAVAVLGLSGKEFLIRYLFAIGRINIWLLAINLAVAVYIATLILSGAALHDSVSAMEGYAGAHVFSLVVGLLAAPLTWRNLSLVATLRSVAANGSWAGLSALIYSLRASAHTFIVGASLSLEDVGRMNAARTLVTAVTLIIPTLSSLMLPRLSQVHVAEGLSGVQRLARHIAVGMAILVLIYAGLLFLAWPLLGSQFLGVGYEGLGLYVVLWILYALSIALRNTLEWASQAIKAFRLLTVVNLTSSAMTIGAVMLLTFKIEAFGAIIGSILGEFAMFLLLALSIFRKTGKSRI